MKKAGYKTERDDEISDGLETCLECHQLFQQSEMVFLSKCWICAECKPVFLQRLREGSGTEGISGKLWRDKDCVVMLIITEMPNLCFKCNTPVTEPKITRNITWLSGRYLACSAGGLALVGAMLIVSNAPLMIIGGAMGGGWLLINGAGNFLCKRFSLRLSLCRKHQRGQFWDRVTSTCLLLATILVLVVYAVSSAKWIAATLILIGLIYARVRANRARTFRVADDHVWLKGAGREFLASLPVWPGAN